jgi:hypothetical protein
MGSREEPPMLADHHGCCNPQELELPAPPPHPTAAACIGPPRPRSGPDSMRDLRQQGATTSTMCPPQGHHAPYLRRCSPPRCLRPPPPPRPLPHMTTCRGRERPSLCHRWRELCPATSSGGGGGERRERSHPTAARVWLLVPLERGQHGR